MIITVESMPGPPMEERQVEIVERKGKGHPDTICDGVMETVSVALNRIYIESFGTPLHNNLDKGLLIAGQAEKWFGGGRVVRPMELVIGDRATMQFDGREVPVASIARQAAREWFSRNLPHLQPERDLDIRIALAPAPAQLSRIYTRSRAVHLANDTSSAIGYWPLTPTEKAVLNLERFLNGNEFKGNFPETGEDVKVMGVRHGSEIDLTVAMPLYCTHIESEEDYFIRKEEIREAILDQFNLRRPSVKNISLNALDAPGQGPAGVYLTLLGTSAEDADSGQVGRGNRVNGLIPLNRPIGTEAVAGKNPFSHVGKIYSAFAFEAARAIGEHLKDVREIEISLVSRIGQPIDEPILVSIRLMTATNGDFPRLRRRAEALLEMELAALPDFCRRLASGEIFRTG